MSTKESQQIKEQLRPKLQSVMQFVADQCQRTVRNYPDYLPMYTVDGKWNREGELWTHWCEGFFPGILWLVYLHTGEEKWRQLAESYSQRLEPRKLDRNVHDLGFIFGSTYFRWYKVSGDANVRNVLIEAGRTLALRRQKGNYLASFIGPESLFIDIMMNVGLILWVANETKDAKLREVALEHCRVTAQTIVRANGSTAHEGIFDTDTGKFLRESTHQGLRANSAWSRGQAWALYGFTTISRLAGDDGDEFLAIAKRCADFYLDKAPGGVVPLWDFDAPKDDKQPFDSSAGAIACSGLWDLAKCVDSEADGERYLLATLRTLDTLCGDEFLASSDPEWEGILKQGVYHIHKNLGVKESVAWGEHFFVEAVMKVLHDGDKRVGYQ